MSMQDKDFCERNHMLSWSIGVALMLIAIVGLLVLFIHVVFVQHDAYMNNRHVRIFLIAVSVFTTAFIIRRYIIYLGERLNRLYLARFKEIKSLGAYHESRPKVYAHAGKQEHAVLLLHGYSSSPQEFVSLCPYLQQANLSYYAPNLEGFGHNTAAVLHHVRYQDWLRCALDAYDLLSQQYEKVSVVGHSLGSVLALYVAEQRSVHKLLLTAPGACSVTQDLKYKALLQLPYFGIFLAWLLPFIPKPVRKGRRTTSDILDTSVAGSAFQYLALPVNSVKQLFDVQDAVLKDLDGLMYQQLIVLYGRHDLTTDNEAFVSNLHRRGYDFSATVYLQSAHNILDDHDKAEVCFAIANHLVSS